MIYKLKNFVLDLVFPRHCLNCNRLGHFICPKCRGEIIKISQTNCPICHQKSENGRLCPKCRPKYRLRGVLAYGFFHDPILKNVIHQFKYEGISSAGEELAELLEPLVPKEIDTLAFVPVSRKRLHERGFNQAKVLAQHLSRLSGKPVYKGLIKTRHTERQVGLKRGERLANLRGVYKVTNEQEIKNKKILLIDDVLTTGATLDNCSRALRSAGAKEIWGLVLARE